MRFVLEFLPTTKILSDVILEGNWSPFYFLSSMFVNNLSEGPTKPNKRPDNAPKHERVIEICLSMYQIHYHLIIKMMNWEIQEC